MRWGNQKMLNASATTTWSSARAGGDYQGRADGPRDEEGVQAFSTNGSTPSPENEVPHSPRTDDRRARAGAMGSGIARWPAATASGDVNDTSRGPRTSSVAWGDPRQLVEKVRMTPDEAERYPSGSLGAGRGRIRIFRIAPSFEATPKTSTQENRVSRMEEVVAQLNHRHQHLSLSVSASPVPASVPRVVGMHSSIPRQLPWSK